MNIKQDLELIKSRIIEQEAENMKCYGYAKTIGLVIAIISEEDKPMNLDQLAKKTGMSKTRMSQILREMNQLHLAEKVFIKGSRKDTYIVEKDKYEMFITLLVQNWRELVYRNAKVEDRLMRDLEEIMNNEHATKDEIDEAQKYYNDSVQSQHYFNWIYRLAHFFESKEIFKHVPIKKDSNLN